MSQSVRDPTILSAPPADSPWFMEIVRDAQAGNEFAFNTLFQHYNAQICTYLARMVGNDEEGRDLAQETFLKVWRTLPGMKDVAQFTTWLYRIATNTAIDHLRRRKLRWPLGKDYELHDASKHSSTTGPEEQVVEAEYIRQALAQLSPQYRACLLLQLVAGFSQREIAMSLNLSEKSISIYVSRGLEQLRKAYERLENE
jgi:RNA polymerase sigma-70 factor, ECF subfamily